MKRLKDRIYYILEVSAPENKDLSYYFDLVLMTLILLNAVALILESVPSLAGSYGPFFRIFNLISVIFFSIEYVLRIWAITSDPHYAHPFLGRLRFLVTPFALIDLLAILPFYITFLGVDMRVVRIFRIFRIFRLFKLVRYAKALRIINGVIKNKKEELVIILFFILFMLLIVSCLMYFVEHEAQPDKFASIPETMWWGVATLTTVGYGDVYPVTNLGRLLAGVIAVLGVGLFALPTGILAAGCAEEIDRVKSAEKETHCPCCGRPHEENGEG